METHAVRRGDPRLERSGQPVPPPPSHHRRHHHHHHRRGVDAPPPPGGRVSRAAPGSGPARPPTAGSGADRLPVRGWRPPAPTCVRRRAAGSRWPPYEPGPPGRAPGSGGRPRPDVGARPPPRPWPGRRVRPPTAPARRSGRPAPTSANPRRCAPAGPDPAARRSSRCAGSRRSRRDRCSGTSRWRTPRSPAAEHVPAPSARLTADRLLLTAARARPGQPPPRRPWPWRPSSWPRTTASRSRAVRRRLSDADTACVAARSPAEDSSRSCLAPSSWSSTRRLSSSGPACARGRPGPSVAVSATRDRRRRASRPPWVDGEGDGPQVPPSLAEADLIESGSTDQTVRYFRRQQKSQDRLRSGPSTEQNRHRGERLVPADPRDGPDVGAELGQSASEVNASVPAASAAPTSAATSSSTRNGSWM